MTVCGDQTFLEQMKWSFQFGISVNDLYIAIFMQLVFNEFQVPSRPDLDYWYQVWVLGYGPKLTYKLLRHAAVDNVTYDISGPSLPPLTAPLRSGLSPPNHSGMSENNKHAFRTSRDPQWRQICVSCDHYERYDANKCSWRRCEFRVQILKLERRNIFAFPIWVLKPRDESEKGGGGQGWGAGAGEEAVKIWASVKWGLMVLNINRLHWA